MVRHLKALTFVLAWCFVGCAALPAPVYTTYPQRDSIRVTLSLEAKQAIDSLAGLTRFTRREQAACVEDYATVRTASNSWIFALITIGPSNAYDSDSLRVWTRNGKDFCPPGTPNLHTHIVQNEVWWRPSDFDMQQAREWPTVLFRVVVSVRPAGGSRVTVYGMK
jgi:hypothetical protein